MEDKSKAEKLRESISEVDSTQYSPAVMQNRALMMLATEDNDSLYEISEEQIPYIAYLRAINTQLSIPGTMAFLHNQLTLSKSKERKGRLEFGQSLNKQPILMPGMPTLYGQVPQQESKTEGLLSRLLKMKSKGGQNNVQ